jgi:hypothetical protein
MLRETFLRAVVLVAAVSALAIPASAQSMQIYGKTGYLGEYDLSGTVLVKLDCKCPVPRCAPLQHWYSRESSVHTRGFSRSRIMAS